MQKNIQYQDYIENNGSLTEFNSETDYLTILFHGYGADASDLASLRDFMTPDKTNMRWVFPEGVYEVPIGPGWTGRAWWNLTLNSLPSDWTDVTPPKIEELVPKVFKMIESLNHPWEKIILGGFSQGAMLATEIYLMAPKKPAGLMSLSGTLIRKSAWAEKLSARKGSNVFLSHGEQDQVLPSSGTQKLIHFFKSAELNCDVVSFRGGHEIPPQVITRAKSYIEKVTKNS